MHSLFKSCCLQMCIKDHFVCRIPSTSETSVKKSCETIRNTFFTLSRHPKYFISPCTNAIQCTMLYYLNFCKILVSEMHLMWTQGHKNIILSVLHVYK